jgi:hypothetical protein
MFSQEGRGTFRHCLATDPGVGTTGCITAESNAVCAKRQLTHGPTKATIRKVAKSKNLKGSISAGAPNAILQQSQNVKPGLSFSIEGEDNLQSRTGLMRSSCGKSPLNVIYGTSSKYFDPMSGSSAQPNTFS